MTTLHDQAEPALTGGGSRRDFLKQGMATALVVGIALDSAAQAAVAATAPAAPATPFAPNAFLSIGADNSVTVFCPANEMGQGVLTAVPMIVAEELDADWASVRVQPAPTDPRYNNPAFGMQGTGGSTTVRAWWMPLRQAGAAARTMLVAAAAEQWHVAPSTLRTAHGEVLAADGRRASYGSLVAAASRQPVPANPVLKDPKDFRLLGTAAKRLDTADKVNGRAKFGLDAPRLPGLLVAVMARAPQPGAKPTRVVDDKAKAVRGVAAVITLPSGIAVLASGYYAAKKGRDLLEIDWDLGANTGLDSARVSRALRQAADSASIVARESGEPLAAAAGRTVEAVYEAPYLAHACMEPMNCTAWVREDRVEIWAGTQSQGPVQGILASVTQLTPAQVTVHPLLLGGGFGRRFAPDFVIDATALSQASGKPVQLIYSREDDMAAGYYRPAAVATFRGVLDGEGRAHSLRAGVSAPSLTAASGFGKLPESGLDAQAVEGLADHPYSIPHQRIAYGRTEPGPQVWFWRSVGHSQNVFFVEGFIDELAAAAKADPYAFRRSMLAGEPRCLGVLDRAATESGWGKPLPAGVHRGIAVAKSFGSYVAEVAEVSVAADGTPRVHRVVAAVDCGQIVNPEIIRRQIEGAIVYGLSAALYGRITFKDGRVLQGNFNDYPVLRMNEMPAVEVHIVQSSEAPGGIGEPGLPPAAPAVVNAIYAATGRRIRRLPIDTAELKAT